MTDDFQRLDDKFARMQRAADLIESQAAHSICEIMRAYAVTKITMQGAVDTGNLRNSVQTTEDIIVRDTDTQVSIGIECTTDYGLFIEFGTGIKGDPAIPHVDKSAWYAPDPDEPGEFILRFAQHPRPFMRPALYDPVETYKGIMEGAITEVFE